MDTIFIDSEKSKTFYPVRLLLNLPDEIDLKRSNKYDALSRLSVCITWKNIKKSYKNNKFKILVPKEIKIWITKWIIPCVRYSKLFWVSHQNTCCIYG